MIVYKDSFDGLVVFKGCSKKFDSLQRKGLLIKDMKRKERGSVAVVYYTARICQSSWGYQVQNKSGGFKEWILISKDGQIQGAEVRVQRKRSWEGHYSFVYPFEVSCATNEKCRPKSELEKSERVRVNQERRKEAVTGKRLRRQWIAELQDKQSLLLTLNSEHGLLCFNFFFR